MLHRLTLAEVLARPEVQLADGLLQPVRRDGIGPSEYHHTLVLA